MLRLKVPWFVVPKGSWFQKEMDTKQGAGKGSSREKQEAARWGSLRGYRVI